MVSKEEFRNYVKTIVADNKENINKEFKKKKKTSPFAFIFIFVVLIVNIFAIINDSIFTGVLITIIIFIVSFVLIIVNSISLYKPSNITKNLEFKDDVIKYLLKDYDYSYDKDGGIDVSEYEKSPMSSYFEKYETEDYLKINVSNDSTHKNDCWLNICDLRTYREVREEDRDSSHGFHHSNGININFNIDLDDDLFDNDPFSNMHSHHGVREEDVFNGSFGYIQFNESFKTNLYINCPSSSFKGKTEYVKLEDINFNKKFWVYSNDQVEARYILNPRMMELVNELNNKVNGGVTKVRRVISIALVDNRMYFTFSGGFKLFELNRHYHDSSEIFDDFYDDMEIILNLVKEIQNNNKIFKI